MNLRINPDSIRFRLDAQDYLALCNHRSVVQQTEFEFGLSIFYEVRYGDLPAQTVDNALHLQTDNSPEGLRLTLTVGPQAQISIATPNPSKEGVRDYQPTPSGGLLTIVLERDIDPRSKGKP
jgi:hypothetical protein